METTKTCKNCGKVFEAKQKQLFCSKTCTHQNFRKKHLISIKLKAKVLKEIEIAHHQEKKKRKNLSLEVLISELIEKGLTVTNV